MYFKKFRKLIKGSIQTDPLPRVIILPTAGIFLLGRDYRESQTAKDIFLSALESIEGTNKMKTIKNWLGNHTYTPKKTLYPASVLELQSIIKKSYILNSKVCTVGDVYSCLLTIILSY